MSLTCSSGYECCTSCSVYSIEDGIEWGIENNQWCEIPSSCHSASSTSCFSYPNYNCCQNCDVVYIDEDGKWGILNDDWCGISDSCSTTTTTTTTTIKSSETITGDISTISNGIIKPDNQYIFYTGRWDDENVAQWPNSGFKLDFTGTSFTFVSGSKSQPVIACGYSLDYQDFVYLNITTGENKILENLKDTQHSIQFWVTNLDGGFLQMDHIKIDNGAKIHKYQPQKKYIQVIGDSLSSGQYSPHESMDSWPFLLGQLLNIEMDVLAIPGIALSDEASMSSWKKTHGMSYQYFMTQHEASEAWGYSKNTRYDFSKSREPDYIIINLGTNDVGLSVQEKQIKTYMIDFVKEIRKVYPNSTIINTNYFMPYWVNAFNGIESELDNLHLYDVSKWIVDGPPDIIPDIRHFSQKGNCEIAYKFKEIFINDFGLSPLGWRTDNWGLSNGSPFATTDEKCKSPYDHTVYYHYKWLNKGGIGYW